MRFELVVGMLLALSLAIFTSDAQVVTTLANFSPTTGGRLPIGQLIRGADGSFYGNTTGGGAVLPGQIPATIFKMTPGGDLTTLATLPLESAPTDGFPSEGLTLGSDGNSYGTTVQGGVNGPGEIFSVTPTGTLKTLYNFCRYSAGSCSNALYTNAPLVEGTDGNFYGIGAMGGANDRGAVFKITPAGSYSTLYSFCSTPNSDGICPDGESPSSLVQGADGSFYGTTSGPMFKITASGSFTNLGQLGTGLVRGVDDNIYGFGTDPANSSKPTTLFKIAPGGAPVTLFNMCLTAHIPNLGICLTGNLVQATDGNFYVFPAPVNVNSMVPSASIFKFTPAGALTELYRFCLSLNSQGYCADGNYAVGALVQVPNEKFYGATLLGGLDNDGTIFTLPLFPGTSALATQVDYLAEGKSDFTIWRPSNGGWYSSDLTGNVVSQQWGVSTDIPLIGDYDGDGKTDIAVWRPSNGTWYVRLSASDSVLAQPWGTSGDIAVPGDYDGDGKTDFAVWRPSNGTWYILLSSTKQVTTRQWGEAGDTAVAADYDGDGKTDIAVWRPSNGTWYIIRSKDNQVITKQWGTQEDMPVPGYYNGFGTADIAVWRPSNGTWYVSQNSDSKLQIQQWGQAGDVPVPLDYNGDGKTDFAIWRPTSGTWYVLPSGGGPAVTKEWGLANDIPVSSTNTQQMQN